MSKEKINFKHDSDFPDYEKYLNIPYDFSPFVVCEGVFIGAIFIKNIR